MPRLQATVKDDTTVIVASIHLRPTLIKVTRRTDPFLVIDVSQDKAVVGGKTIVVADKLKIVTGTKSLDAACQARARHARAGVLQRDGKTYKAVS